MERVYFSKEEARSEIGTVVEALADFPSVPRGTRGTVTKVVSESRERWLVLVRWDLPIKTWAFEAMILDTSLNFTRSSNPVTDQFCKSEYESLVRVFAPAKSA